MYNYIRDIAFLEINKSHLLSAAVVICVMEQNKIKNNSALSAQSLSATKGQLYIVFKSIQSIAEYRKKKERKKR